MNYNITYAREPKIDYYRVTSYGGMPTALMASKYETSDPEEDIAEMLDSHHRGVLADRGPDKPFLVSAEPSRRPGGYSEEVINSRINGHRGTAEDPYRPEEFYGFAGAGDRDPRGTAIDPDFSRVRAESASRARFQRLGAEPMKMQIPEGPRAEARVVSDNNRAVWSGGRRIKVFDRQLTNAPRRGEAKYDQVSVFERINAENPRGEGTSDNYIPRGVGERPVDPTGAGRKRGFAALTSTQEFGVANYGALRKVAALADPTSQLDFAMPDGEFLEGYTADNSRYKSMIQSMASIVRSRGQQLASHGGTDLELMDSGVATPTGQNAVRSLASKLANQVATADWDDQTSLAARKIKLPGRHMSAGRNTAQSHTADYVLHNAQLFYKTAKRPEDMARVRGHIITSRVVPETAEGSAARRKMKMPTSRGGANLLQQTNHKHGRSLDVKAYGGIKALPRGGTEKFIEGSVDFAQGYDTPHQRAQTELPSGSNNPHVVSDTAMEDTRMRYFHRGSVREKDARPHMTREAGLGEQLGDI